MLSGVISIRWVFDGLIDIAGAGADRKNNANARIGVGLRGIIGIPITAETETFEVIAAIGASVLTGAISALEVADGGTMFELAGGTNTLELAGGAGFELTDGIALELTSGMTAELAGGVSRRACSSWRR